MNPYQIMGVIAVCATVFAGVVALLASQGVPVITAFLCVYLLAIGFMLSLQRRARQAAGEIDYPQQCITDNDGDAWEFNSSSTLTLSDGERRRVRRFGV